MRLLKTLIVTIAALLFIGPLFAEMLPSSTAANDYNTGIDPDKLLNKAGVPTKKFKDDFLYALSRGLVTGEALYPTPFVFHSLGLPHWSDPKQDLCIGLSSKYEVIFPRGAKLADWQLPVEKLKQMNILSIGEGFSGLVPNLRARGSRAVGLDLPGAYEYMEDKNGQKLAKDSGNAYLDKFSGYLIHGDATKLTETAKRCSQDLVLSHSVFAHIGKGGREGAMIEAIKQSLMTLRKGGQFRINITLAPGYLFEKVPSDKEVIEKVNDWLSNLCGDCHEYLLLRGKTECKGDSVSKVTECFVPDTTTKDIFTKELLRQEVLAKASKEKVWKWPTAKHEDDLILIFRRKS